jgi:adenylosuccinate lyase
VIEAEIGRYLPFLATTKLLMHGVRNGLGREEAHEVIRQHAVASALAMRRGADGGEHLLLALGDDPLFPGSRDELAGMVADDRSLLGTIDAQVAHFCEEITALRAGRSQNVYRGSAIA